MSLVIITTRCLTAITLFSIFSSCAQLQTPDVLEWTTLPKNGESKQNFTAGLVSPESSLQLWEQEDIQPKADILPKITLNSPSSNEPENTSINSDLNVTRFLSLQTDELHTFYSGKISIIDSPLDNSANISFTTLESNSVNENSSIPQNRSNHFSSKNSSSFAFNFVLNITNTSDTTTNVDVVSSRLSKNASVIDSQYSGHLNFENSTSLPFLYINKTQESITTPSVFNSFKDAVTYSINDAPESTTIFATSNEYSKSTSNYDYVSTTENAFPEMLPTPLPLSKGKAQFLYNKTTSFPEKINSRTTPATTASPYAKLWESVSLTTLPLLKYKPPVRLLSRSFLNPHRSYSSFRSGSYSHPSASYLMTSTPATLFDPNSPKNISAQMGSSVYIPCKIRNLGNKTVSWIRNRDSHILTVGRFIFIADARFDAWHEEDTDTWILLIKYIQERDKGFYECQVSTEPKMSHFVYFNVVSPLVTIPGGSDIHVKVGSTVSIKCFITNAIKQPQYIFWYKGKERVVDERKDGPKIFLERITNDTSVGTLVIPNASPSDAGMYQCVPEKLKPANVTLHVINGEHPAAMQQGTSAMIGPGSPGLLILSLFLSMFMQIFAHGYNFSHGSPSSLN